MSNEPLPPDIKPYPFNGYAPGNYMNKCSSCGTMMGRVDKLCFVCLECAIKGAISEISLQKAEIERLKELMERIVRQNHVIYRGQNSSMTESQVAKEVELIWGHFKAKHNL